MADIVNAIWGSSADIAVQQSRIDALSRYIDYCEGEIGFACRDTWGFPVSRADLIDTIEHLKQRPTLPRAGLQDDDDGANKMRLLLDFAVRLMYGTACVALGDVGGDIFRPAWKESESLAVYVGRIYPRSSVPPDSRPVRIHKLSMGYLSAHADVDIRWTHRLSDHLILLKGENWKSLYVFRHPAFLKLSIETLRENNLDLEQSTADSLALGCLPPGLIRETLKTYSLLFPRVGDQQSRVILEREVARHRLDAYFLEPSELEDQRHSSFRDALDPTDIRGLYEKYPYWGDRLYDVWKEADDPTPITAIERWSDARRSPRFTYWCTVVSVSIAIAFGMAATVLGAIQVWISYCDWVNDPTRPMCHN